MGLIAFENKKGEWVIDSGASRHMCAEKNAIVNLKQSTAKFMIAANGHKISVLGEGCVNIQAKVGDSVTQITL